MKWMKQTMKGTKAAEWVVAAAVWMGWALGTGAADFNLQPAPISDATKARTSFAVVVKKAASSVVNIYSSKTVRMDPNLNPFFSDPFFRRFFGEEPDSGRARQPRTRREQSLGSGVIVTENGYILTNHHVVEGADEIRVVFADRREMVAKIVGTDPQTEVAIIKVDARRLPALPITDSDNLEVGDVVFAIGNPFGVGQTVTMGIVSATGRGGFGIVDYEDFIQTDASINPGNSGGALVDAEGRLVGINTAILSRSGGNQGIGFAVPINMARAVMDRILKDGKVVRGYLGVSIQPLTPDLAEEFGLKNGSGALVAAVSPGTPAEKAGLKEGDVVVEFEGKKVEDSRQLRLMVAQTPPGAQVRFKVMREGKERQVSATLAELPADGIASVESPDSKGNDVLDGITVGDLDNRTRRQFEIPSAIEGALVIEVDPDSPAFNAGLRVGDVIIEINRRAVANADEAVELSERLRSNRALLRVWSRGITRYVVVEETSKPKP